MSPGGAGSRGWRKVALLAAQGPIQPGPDCPGQAGQAPQQPRSPWAWEPRPLVCDGQIGWQQLPGHEALIQTQCLKLHHGSLCLFPQAMWTIQGCVRGTQCP